MIIDDIKNRILEDMYNYLSSNPVIKIKIEKDNEYYDNGIHCSSLGFCKRKAVYDFYKFEKQPYDLQTLLVFARGNFYHELIYRWLKYSSQFKLIHKEFDISAGLPDKIKGKFDVCFKDKISNKKILADIKTANSNQFKKYSSYLPKNEHIIQLSAYAEGYKNLGYNFDYNLIMYFSTGADLPQLYFVDLNEDINTIMDEYIKAIEKYKTDEILPDKIEDESKIWQCSYCNYNDYCKEE